MNMSLIGRCAGTLGVAGHPAGGGPRASNRVKSLKPWIGAAIGLALLAFVVASIDWARLRDILAASRPVLLVPIRPLFGSGWDIFGTGDYTLNISIINARILWFLSAGLIVLGHVLAVYLAHHVGIRTFSDGASAMASQYPLLTPMVLYTIISLWIIAQPIVQ